MQTDILTVTYGDCEGVVPLLQSLRNQESPIATIWIRHNGPNPFARRLLQDFADLNICVDECGNNLGYGAGINRVFDRSTAAVAVVVNPDVELNQSCVGNLFRAATTEPCPVLVGGLLLDQDQRVNAFAMSLTHDGLGINLDRGTHSSEFGPAAVARAQRRALAPSGALFAVNRGMWKELGGGPLFVESLFLYLEDVALGLHVHRRGGVVRFCSEARGAHRFSDTTGRRSALKLFHVERNRLWLQRALAGRAHAALAMPFTFVRLAAYATQAVARSSPATANIGGTDSFGLARVLLDAWKEGFMAPLPSDLVPYLGANTMGVSLRQFAAPLKSQLRDPTA